MLPIVEMATHPVQIVEPLYLYEPSGKGKAAERADREATIARIAAKAPATPGHGVRGCLPYTHALSLDRHRAW